MAKQLRLDVAQLTDVGRKREHNEDNMAYVIPKDPQVMAKKGALFIVADGMGGHAAGEVASEIAVDTVSNVFYQDDSDDVAASLLHAIKRANSSIHQRAAENMLRSGMGTTCVAAVLRGNMAYIANVGDSRAYLVRGGQVKQVSQDHSWVAEQVRAGLLTEDQARTHAQRNVITRSLGTQPEVEVDVFSEALEEGDSFVLCTDGLSGLVSDDELRRIVHDFIPQESVYHLVERANENGGPDNITAIVAYVAEVGAEVNGVRRPARVGAGNGRDTTDSTMMTPMQSSPVPYAATSAQGNEGRATSSPLQYSPAAEGPLSPAGLPLASKKKHGRLLFPALALLILLSAGLAGGAYYFLTGRAANADQSITNAQALIAQAGTALNNSDPVTSLKKLAQAQTLLKDLRNQPLTTDQRQRTNTLLQDDITTSTSAAIKSYNKLFLISSLPCNGTQNKNITPGVANSNPLNIIAVNDDKGNTLLYALAQDGSLYQVSNNSFAKQLRGPAQIISASGSNSNNNIYTLMTQATNGTSPASYSIAVFQAGQNKFGKSTPISSTALKNGLTPRFIASWDNDIYVVLTAANGTNTAEVLNYKADNPGNAPAISPISVTANITSMTAYPDHQLFLLLSDGSVKSVQVANATQHPGTTSNVLVQSPLRTPLTTGSKNFSADTDTVPTVTTTGEQKGPTPLAIANSLSLSSGKENGTPHLFIADGANHSILDLQATNQATASSSGSTASANGTVVNGTGGNIVNPNNPTAGNGVVLQLSQQYTSSQLLTQMKGVAVDPKGPVVYALTQGNTPKGTSPDLSNYNLVSISLAPQNSCS